ncbi:MAG TPA: hypothetical protein PKW29_06170, partial [Clostridia bacterium]|nr:hypothetical protein [Clostridia bacterium]
DGCERHAERARRKQLNTGKPTEFPTARECRRFICGGRPMRPADRLTTAFLSIYNDNILSTSHHAAHREQNLKTGKEAQP